MTGLNQTRPLIAFSSFKIPLSVGVGDFLASCFGPPVLCMSSDMASWVRSEFGHGSHEAHTSP
jgi:hypothetical protein